MDGGNVIEGKRHRGSVDFAKLAKVGTTILPTPVKKVKKMSGSKKDDTVELNEEADKDLLGLSPVGGKEEKAPEGGASPSGGEQVGAEGVKDTPECASGALSDLPSDLVERAKVLAERALALDQDSAEFEQVMAAMTANRRKMNEEAEKVFKSAKLQEELAELEQSRIRLQTAREDEERAKQDRQESFNVAQDMVKFRKEVEKKGRERDRRDIQQFKAATEWYRDDAKTGSEQPMSRDQFELLKELAKDKNLVYCSHSGVARLANAKTSHNDRSQQVESDDELRALFASVMKQGGGDVESTTHERSLNDIYRSKGVEKLNALGLGTWPGDGSSKQVGLDAMPPQWKRKLMEAQVPLDEEGECDENQVKCCKCKAKKESKSGRLDKPSTDVKTRLSWPHMFQNKRYVTKGLLFDELSFEQLVGGEARIMLGLQDKEQMFGRLRVLECCAYWLDRSKDWTLVRGIYTAIMESIERGDENWASDFYHYDALVARAKSNWDKHDKGKVAQTKKAFEYYCREYNRGECTLSAPHKAWVKGENRKVLHCCAACLRKDKEIRSHMQSDLSCPHYREEGSA